MQRDKLDRSWERDQSESWRDRNVGERAAKRHRRGRSSSRSSKRGSCSSSFAIGIFTLSNWQNYLERDRKSRKRERVHYNIYIYIYLREMKKKIQLCVLIKKKDYNLNMDFHFIESKWESWCLWEVDAFWKGEKWECWLNSKD